MLRTSQKDGGHTAKSLTVNGSVYTSIYITGGPQIPPNC